MQWVNRLHFQNFWGDCWGGLTATILALPLALAFGVALGAGAIAGPSEQSQVDQRLDALEAAPPLIRQPIQPIQAEV